MGSEMCIRDRHGQGEVHLVRQRPGGRQLPGEVEELLVAARRPLGWSRTAADERAGGVDHGASGHRAGLAHLDGGVNGVNRHCRPVRPRAEGDPGPRWVDRTGGRSSHAVVPIPTGRVPAGRGGQGDAGRMRAVSYTHLTLPTKA